MLKLIALITLTTSVLANTIKDPNGYLNQLDSFGLQRSFADEFVVGDQIETEQEICDIDQNGDMDCQMHYNQINVNQTTQDYALLDSGLIITKTKYLKNKKNPVRFFFNEQDDKILAKANINKNNDYYYELTDLYIDNSDPAWAEATLSFDIVIIDSDGSEFRIPMELEVERDAPFMGQISSLSVDSINGGYSTIFRVNSWIKF